MEARQAIDRLDPEKWRSTSAEVKLKLLKEIRGNIARYMEALARSDSEMKNKLLGSDVFHLRESLAATAVPVGSTVSACIDLYESLVKGRMPEPIEVKGIGDDLYDIHVFPKSAKDRVIYGDRKDYLRVKGKPKQINPMDKPGGIIGVLGAGNYSSSIEMVTALFLENCAVVHKPHELNEETDEIWAKIMQPLVDLKALTFSSAREGRELVTDKLLTKIYFTGGSGTAKIIMESIETELISECGGNNPCIIVPGNKPWSRKQIKHQAMQLATVAKMNGGAVCGRIQTIVTSKRWPQREEFLEALKIAIEEETPAAGSYYPGSERVAAEFKKNHPEGVGLESKGGRVKGSTFLFVEGIDEDSFAVKNEAFCQVTTEISLDIPAEADLFLPKAVEFCNTKLLGTLGSSIIIDRETEKNHRAILEQAVNDLKYGAVGINTMPPMIWLNPYLTWGGNEEGRELVSGYGNFGNILCFENVEKSIVYSGFMSPGHMINSNKETFNKLAESMAKYSVEPSWKRLMGMLLVAINGSFKGKDF